MSDETLIDAYVDLWPDADIIRQAAIRCGGPRRPRRARDYLGFDLLNAGLREVWSLAESMALTQDSAVLEIGCGIGGPLRHVAERFECRATGIDINPRQLRRARALTMGLDVEPLVSFAQADATRLPFCAGTFSHVYSFEAFVHVANKRAAMAEAYRVLSPGGRFCIQDPVHPPEMDIAMLEGTLHPLPPATYAEQLQKAGFTDLDITDRTVAAYRAYRQLAELISAGPLMPWRLRAIMDFLHPGVRPPLRRFISPGRLRYVVRYLADRNRAALDLLETPERVQGVRRMCEDIVAGFDRGEITMYRLLGHKPSGSLHNPSRS